MLIGSDSDAITLQADFTRWGNWKTDGKCSLTLRNTKYYIYTLINEVLIGSEYEKKVKLNSDLSLKNNALALVIRQIECWDSS